MMNFLTESLKEPIDGDFLITSLFQISPYFRTSFVKNSVLSTKISDDPLLIIYSKFVNVSPILAEFWHFTLFRKTALPLLHFSLFSVNSLVFH